MADSKKVSPIISLHEHTDLQAQEAYSLLGRAVRPIFVVTRKREPEFWGSGVLLAVGDARFLVTAAHVLHDPEGELAHGTLHGVAMTFGSETHVELSGRVHRTVPPAGKSYEDDQVDVAALELSATEAAQIDDAYFVSLKNIDVRDHLAPRRGYFHIGFPGRKQKRDLPNATFKVVPFPYIGWEVAPDLYEAIGYDRLTNLAIKFDQKAIWMEGRVGAAPSPRGTSGGGWWRLDGPFRPVTEDAPPKLVAVTSKHYPQDEKLLLSVRVSRIVQLLTVARPDLASLLPDVSFLPSLGLWRTVAGPFVPVS